MVAALNGRFCSTTVSVNPGHVTKWLFLIAVFHVDFTGEKHAACRYFTRSIFVCFFFMITEIFDVIVTEFHVLVMTSLACNIGILSTSLVLVVLCYFAQSFSDFVLRTYMLRFCWWLFFHRYVSYSQRGRRDDRIVYALCTVLYWNVP